MLLVFAGLNKEIPTSHYCYYTKFKLLIIKYSIIGNNFNKRSFINMQSNKTCPILEQYLNYLTIIKGRSNNTILEYRIDLL